MTATASPQLLIVDDEVPHIQALCDTLKDQGFMPTGFTSPQAALTAMRGQQFDLLLTDLMMPEMDGINLLRAALEIDSSLVGIMMTGHGTIGTAVEAMKAGALDYIIKPFKLSAILPVLSRALAVRRLRLENVALQRSLSEHAARLEAANQELEAFSYSVSHDLRAPLRHIDGFTHLLGEVEPSMSDSGRNYLGRITNATQQMTRLIEDLLTFSRTSRAEMHRGRVSLEHLVDEVLQNAQPELAGRNIIWKKGPLPVVEGDRALLRQVLSNLILNAVKYTRPRNPAEIEIGCLDDPGEEVVIFIRDNGVGFDMAYADKLFGVFQRLHRQDEFEGTGVGLANVRRIIARHGGRTWAEATLNAGATFFFSLPKAAV